jgi:hypothetical protein
LGINSEEEEEEEEEEIEIPKSTNSSRTLRTWGTYENMMGTKA